MSDACRVEESLSDFGTVRAFLPDGFPAYARVLHPAYLDGNSGRCEPSCPDGFPAYARVLHPAYLDGNRERPVRWSTVASWTGRTVHPLMQFARIANLGEDLPDIYKDPAWGSRPQEGSIPDRECRTLVEVLRDFTSTPGSCCFCLWESYGNIDTRYTKPVLG